MKKAIMYIHGKGGSHLEAEGYKKNCPDYDIVGVEYDEYLPWLVANRIRAVYAELSKSYDQISLLANSIGAYLGMYALQNCKLAKALLISPVLDMERLILDMMGWARVTEEELSAKGEIPTEFGETLSWEYLTFVRQHPIDWTVPTEILYAEKDNLTSRNTVDAFVATHPAKLTVMAGGEHWFHTEEQLAFLNKWMKTALSGG